MARLSTNENDPAYHFRPPMVLYIKGVLLASSSHPQSVYLEFFPCITFTYYNCFLFLLLLIIIINIPFSYIYSIMESPTTSTVCSRSPEALLCKLDIISATNQECGVPNLVVVFYYSFHNQYRHIHPSML